MEGFSYSLLDLVHGHITYIEKTSERQNIKQRESTLETAWLVQASDSDSSSFSFMLHTTCDLLVS